ncbi:MAG: response regulator transcription factor [Rhodospirillales bacterium]|nr:response regulator transcription factor [Rhodospirillales bacterium]MBO6786157.1 response regulator transcription factor [Rhodospirillales bacterium]
MDYTRLSVLIVEDDPDIAGLVEHCLKEIAITPVVVGSNAEARDALANNTFNIVIADLSLPDGDGLSLARDVAALETTGLIILTGRAETTDKIIGLEMGADDYITKPFERRELNARVKGLARRIMALKNVPQTSDDDAEVIRFGDWSMLLDKMRIEHEDGRGHDLNASEFELLKMFVDRPGRILSRDQIMDFLFTNASPAFDRSIDVRVSRLRSKIEEDPKHPNLIVTARNVGYVFRAKVVR